MSMKKVVVAGGGVLEVKFHFKLHIVELMLQYGLEAKDSIEISKPKLERFKNTYIDTLEKMKTDESTYCRGLSKTKDLSESEIE